MRRNQQLPGLGLQGSERHTPLMSQTRDAAVPVASVNEAWPVPSGQTHSVQHQSSGPPFSRDAQAGQCEGSSPYFWWRMAVVLSRALRKKWRAVKVRLLKALSPPESGDQRPLNPLILTMLSSPNPWWILWVLKKPAHTSKLSPPPSTTSPNLPTLLRTR